MEWHVCDIKYGVSTKCIIGFSKKENRIIIINQK